MKRTFTEYQQQNQSPTEEETIAQIIKTEEEEHKQLYNEDVFDVNIDIGSSDRVGPITQEDQLAADIIAEKRAKTYEISNELASAILESNLKSENPMSHHIASYDYLISHMIPHIIREKNGIVEPEGLNLKVEYEFCNVQTFKPQIREDNGDYHAVYPRECVDRTLTYSCCIAADLKLRYYTKHSKSNMVDLPQDPSLYQEIEGGYSIWKKSQCYEDVTICHIPCLVGSSYCHTTSTDLPVDMSPYDPKCYFIINGIEKTSPCQEKLRSNWLMLRALKDKNEIMAEIRSISESKYRSTSTLKVYMTKKGEGNPIIKVDVPYINALVTPMVIFRLLGINDMQIAKDLILLGEEDNEKMDNLCNSILNCEQDLNGVSLRREKDIRQSYINFCNEFLPHMGSDTQELTNQMKAFAFASLVREMCLFYLGKRRPDNRDHYTCKRVDLIGSLFAYKFRSCFAELICNAIKKWKSQLSKRLDIRLDEDINSKTITSALEKAVSKGIFDQGSATHNVNHGMAQIRNVQNIASLVSQGMRIDMNTHKESKVSEMRQISADQFGFICKDETPENKSCGITKFKTLFSRIRVGYPAVVAENLLDQASEMDEDINDDDMIPLKKTLIANQSVVEYGGGTKLYDFRPVIQKLKQNRTKTEVIVNGRIWGYCRDGKEREKWLFEMRRKGFLPFDVTFYYLQERKQLWISTDMGCYLCPVLNLSLMNLIPTIYTNSTKSNFYTNMVNAGVIEYVDPNMVRNMLIAIHNSDFKRYANVTYTHRFFHNISQMGLTASLGIYPVQNPACRNTYQAGMIKQAASQTFEDPRFDTNYLELVNSQRPLVYSAVESMIGLDQSGYGEMMMVAIMCDENNEDAVVFKQSAIDNGKGALLLYQTYKTEKKTKNNDSVDVCKPDSSVKGMRNINYSHITETGMPEVGACLKNNDAVIGRVVSVKSVDRHYKSEKEFAEKKAEGKAATGKATKLVKKDQSLLIKSKGDNHVVFRTLKTRPIGGSTTYKVNTYQYRTPQVGDKFSSRHGQKQTVSIIKRDEDMPFVQSSGIIPDMTINAHCVASRKTVAMLTEGFMGVLATIFGHRIDGTCGNNYSMEDIRKLLIENGHAPSCQERMVNGKTGELIESPVFIFPLYYQRLKHLAADKQHARFHGPVTFLTNQPTEGRSKEGGLRFGEMERDCLISYGSAELLRDRLFFQSDMYEACVCERCGLLASSKKVDDGTGSKTSKASIRHESDYCLYCKTSETVRRVPIPYATKLLIYEMLGLGYQMRLHLSRDLNGNLHCHGAQPLGANNIAQSQVHKV